VQCAVSQRHARHCRGDQRRLLSVALREVFNAGHRDQARDRLATFLERVQPVAPKVCRLLEDAEEDLIAFLCRFGQRTGTKLRSTDPPERSTEGSVLATNVVGIFRSGASVIRLAGALVSEQDDE
jgi:putative transposase